MKTESASPATDTSGETPSKAADTAPHSSTSEDSPPRELSRLDLTLAVGGIVVFVALLFVLIAPQTWLSNSFLSPLLIGMAGAILLWPLRDHVAARSFMLSGGFLLLIWLLTELSAVLAPFVIVYLLAYLLNPAVSKLNGRFNVPRWSMSLLMTAVVVGLIVLVFVLLVPTIANELTALGTRLLNSVNAIQDGLGSWVLFDVLEQAGFGEKDALIAQITETIEAQAENLSQRVPEAVGGLLRSATSFLGTLTTLALVPILLFYTLKDYPLLKDRIVSLFPTFAGGRGYLAEAGGIVGNYLRGQLTISIIGGTLTSVTLLLFGIPFALLIGILAGLLNFIPNLGVMFTHIIGILLMLIFGDPWFIDAAIVVGVLLAYSFFEQSVLTPNILGNQMGMHPVLILLSLFVFGYFLGVFGLLIAVPATALLVAIYKTYGDDLTLELAPVPRMRKTQEASTSDDQSDNQSAATQDDDAQEDDGQDDDAQEDDAQDDETSGSTDDASSNEAPDSQPNGPASTSQETNTSVAQPKEPESPRVD